MKIVRTVNDLENPAKNNTTIENVETHSGMIMKCRITGSNDDNQDAEMILEAFNNPKQQNDVIDLQGYSFKVREIREIIDMDKAYSKISTEEEKEREKYVTELNRKREIPEWSELETKQYELLIEDAKLISGDITEVAKIRIKEIAEEVETNSNKMKILAQ